MRKKQATVELRSKIMSSVKSKNTCAEVAVRHVLRSLGYYYRLHGKSLPGTPDIFFKGRKKAIFVHGCFWHGHSCNKGKLPKTNVEFWQNKVGRNSQRDVEVQTKLEQLGWNVLTVWQCELRDLETLKIKLAGFMDK